MREGISLFGKYVYMEEIQPKHFPFIIEWRNNPKNNKFLNQPFKLNLELQMKWYKDIYLNDNTQGLLIMVDRISGKPFGTIGWTDYNVNSKVCIGGRLLVGEHKYRGDTVA